MSSIKKRNQIDCLKEGNTMFEIKGKYNTAKVYATTVENECIAQIMDLCNQKWLEGCNIAIMPDCHAGKGCTIGTTIKLKDKVAPSLVGVDIACGMLTIKLPKQLIVDIEKLDKYINENIPAGFNVNDEPVYRFHEFNIEKLLCYDKLKNVEYLKKSLGSLGGGNHFIELSVDKQSNQYLIIHSGSRNLGKQVAKIYQHMADEYCNHMRKDKLEARWKLIDKLKAEGRQKEISSKLEEFEKNYIEQKRIPHDLCYLEGMLAEDYLHDVRICTQFASLNRRYIAKSILEFIVKENGYDDGNLNVYIDETHLNQFTFGFDNNLVSVQSPGFETLHNYVSDDRILRKGAISAKEGEVVLIPINMKDGSIIGIGKGNTYYNQSGPHGAGRLMSRNKAKEIIKLEEFQASMKGVYSTSVCVSTIDESPMAYKPIEEIIENIKHTVKLEKILKPIYNFKAH